MKKIVFSLIIFCLGLPVLAEKIPIRITPTQIISTHHDEIETGDWIEFAIIDDVYKKDKLYLAKDTRVVGFVDYFYPNGWVNDSAEIKFKKFRTKDVYQRLVLIEYPLKIDGDVLRAKNTGELFVKYVGRWFRGTEIFIEPNDKAFNLFIED